MIDFGALDAAFALLSSSWTAWVFVLPGLIIGLFFGAMPGISITMAMAIFLPMTLYMDFLPAIIFLTAIYTGAGFGGSVPAVLMNIPGTSSALATTFDGYPMARQGRHNEALGLALTASVLGCLASYILLLVLIAPVSHVVLKMGPLELFVIAVWGLLLLGSLSGNSLPRGLLAGVFGVLLGTIGMNTAGFIRGTMGVPWLLDGIPTIPAMMGLLAASQLLGLINTSYLIEDEGLRKISMSKILAGVKMAVKEPKIIIRGTLIGVIVGSIPGVGSSISNLLSYSEAQRTSEDGESFGKGNPKGVIAAEAANSSSEGGGDGHDVGPWHPRWWGDGNFAGSLCHAQYRRWPKLHRAQQRHRLRNHLFKLCPSDAVVLRGLGLCLSGGVCCSGAAAVFDPQRVGCVCVRVLCH